MKSCIRSAFTLAEVLIVLAIIGIVASLTIPTLVNKIQKHEYVVALKKFYTTQMDGYSRLLADEGVDQLEDTSVFQSIAIGACYQHQANGATSCKPFFNNLKKYFKFNVITAPNEKSYYLDGTNRDYARSIVLAFADD